MISSLIRRCLATTVLLLAATSGTFAGNYSFSTPQNIDFNGLGGSVYYIDAYASVTVGSTYYASSSLSVGNFSLYDSSSGYGESECYMSISGVRLIHGQWVADSVYTYEQNLNGSPITNTYYNVAMSALTYVTGYTYCNGYSNPFSCYVNW